MIDLVGHFSRSEDTILGQLREMVETESPSTDKAAADRMAQLLARLSGEAGGRVELHYGIVLHIVTIIN